MPKASRLSAPDPRVVVITGASAGVGRAAARAFASRGDNIALLARGTDGLEAARREIEGSGRRALVVPVDVADCAAVDDAASRIESELGPIDVWVNNAMTSVLAPVAETDPDDFRRVTEVTYLGCVHGTMAALSRMRERDRGTIIQVGSALSYRAIPLQASYCGAKYAIRGFTDALRTELLHDRSAVRVSMVQLPGLDTPQFGWVKTTLHRHPQPVPPIYVPEVAANAIVWTADHPRREVWVGAPTPLVIWGSRLASGLLDRYLARTNVDAQQSEQPIEPDRPTNLWEPVPGDHGPRGIFGDTARARSLQLTVATHRGALAATSASAAVGTATALLRRRRRGKGR
ncbi:MAG TPA: SDR family oxidoreductase [Acidimicrobiales bacterium]|nr:SDR family oxidoreductase [Acidimicrobiales bacterium]